MKVEDLAQLEVITGYDLTPLEHKMMGSTVDARYRSAPDVPLTVQDGESIEEVNERRKQEKHFIDSVTGISVTDRPIAAIMELGTYDTDRRLFSHPRLVGLFNEMTRQFLPVTQKEQDKYQEYLEGARRELLESVEPREGNEELRT